MSLIRENSVENYDGQRLISTGLLYATEDPASPGSWCFDFRNLFNSNYDVYKIFGSFRDPMIQGTVLMNIYDHTGGLASPTVKRFTRTLQGTDGISDPPVEYISGISSSGNAALDVDRNSYYEITIANPYKGSTNNTVIYAKLIHGSDYLVGVREYFNNIDTLYISGFTISLPGGNQYMNMSYTCIAYPYSNYLP